MAVPEKIAQKIDQLFTYRRIPAMLDIGGISATDDFVERLHELQAAIYALDEYLENHWEVRKKDLAEYWKEINNQLREFGLNRKEVASYRKDIERYQKYELEMRDGKFPLRRKMKTTYWAKSCDVTLIRKLIYREAPVVQQHFSAYDWRPYDLVSEVNDDIEDVYEDTEVFNGNRFLISLIVSGKSETRQEYRAFLKEIKEMTYQRFMQRYEKEAQQLARWTDQRILQTERLMEKRFSQKKLSKVQRAIIMQHLDQDL